MRLILTILCSTMLLSCSSKKENLGPLSRFKEFELVLFFSHFEDFNKEHLTNVIIQRFEKFGDVKIIEKHFFERSNPILFLSLGGYQEKGEGSICVIGDVKITNNGFNIACPIWKEDYYADNLPFPVIEGDKISFKRKEEDYEKTKKNPESTINKLIDDFAGEYRKSNPNAARPVFYEDEREHHQPCAGG